MRVSVNCDDQMEYLYLPVARERHGSGVFSRTVFTAEGSVDRVLGSHVVLESHGVDKTFLPTDLTLIDHISTGASSLVELVVVPLLQGLVTGRTVDLLVGILLSVFPLDPVMSLHNMSVQSLLVLGSVVAALPVTGETDFLTLAMLLPVVFIEQMFVAVAFVTNIADVFFRDVILHVKKEFLGGEF